MKRLLLGMLTVMMLVMAGCGGGSSVVVVPANSPPPTITAIQFNNDMATSFINGSVVFVAPIVDLDTITIIVTDSGGVVVYTTVIDLRAFSGLATGTIPFSIDYLLFLPGNYGFEIFLTDLAGSLSNSEFGTFQVP